MQVHRFSNFLLVFSHGHGVSRILTFPLKQRVGEPIFLWNQMGNKKTRDFKCEFQLYIIICLVTQSIWIKRSSSKHVNLKLWLTDGHFIRNTYSLRRKLDELTTLEIFRNSPATMQCLQIIFTIVIQMRNKFNWIFEIMPWINCIIIATWRSALKQWRSNVSPSAKSLSSLEIKCALCTHTTKILIFIVDFGILSHHFIFSLRNIFFYWYQL